MREPSVNQIQERNRLDALVRQRRLYCERHQRVITPRLFWEKRCYAGRDGDSCRYMTQLRAPSGEGEK